MSDPNHPASPGDKASPDQASPDQASSDQTSPNRTATGERSPAKTETHQRKPTVALVLGSGGARGYAHIGVIEVLEARGYEIIAISGCSMGALVGGIYAAGRLKDYKDWVTGLGQFDVLRMLDISLSLPGAIRGDKIFAMVRELTDDLNIEDLPIAYTAVATDLLAHKEIWFQEGPLHRAIRASVAIPSLLTPVLLGGRVLVDGGLLNPLPIMPTIAAHADYIIAVNLSGEDESRLRLRSEQELEEAGEVDLQRSDLEDWFDRVKERTLGWFDRDAKAGSDKGSDKGLDKGLDKETKTASVINRDASQALDIGKFDIMNLAFEAMQVSLTQYKLAGYPPDLLIEIPKHFCKTFDYHKAAELIQIGRARAEAALDRFEKQVVS